VTAAPGFRRLALRIFWLVVVLSVAGWALVHGFQQLGGPTEVRRILGLPGIVVLIPVHAVVAVTPFPGEAVAVTNSIVYGPWWGALMNWTGWMLAAVMEYRLVRRAVGGFQIPAETRGLPAWLRMISVHHPMFLIVSRWLPFGSHIANSAAGATRVPMPRYLWTAAVGVLPPSVLIAYTASKVSSLWAM